MGLNDLQVHDCALYLAYLVIGVDHRTISPCTNKWLVEIMYIYCPLVGLLGSVGNWTVSHYWLLSYFFVWPWDNSNEWFECSKFGYTIHTKTMINFLFFLYGWRNIYSCQSLHVEGWGSYQKKVKRKVMGWAFYYYNYLFIDELWGLCVYLMLTYGDCLFS